MLEEVIALVEKHLKAGVKTKFTPALINFLKELIATLDPQSEAQAIAELDELITALENLSEPAPDSESSQDRPSSTPSLRMK